MSRIYGVTLSFTLTAAGGNSDMVELKPADDKPIKLRSLMLSQSSEVGDAAEENLQISILRMAATVTDAAGTGSTSVTPVTVDSADAAAGFSCIMNSPTVATTSGATTTLQELGWNERNTPFEIVWPDPATAWKAKQGEALLIRNNTTVADDITMQVFCLVEEE